MLFIIFLTIIVAVVYMIAQIVKAIIQRQPIEALLFWPFWAVSSVLMSVLAVAIRQVWLPTDAELANEEAARSWGMMQGLDAFGGALLFVLVGLAVIGVNAIYRRQLWERFALVTAAQLAAIAGFGLLQSLLGKRSLNLAFTTGMVAGGILLHLVFRAIQRIRGDVVYPLPEKRKYGLPDEPGFRFSRADLDRIAEIAVAERERSAAIARRVRIVAAICTAPTIFGLGVLLAPVYRTNGLFGALTVLLVLAAILYCVARLALSVAGAVGRRHSSGR